MRATLAAVILFLGLIGCRSEPSGCGGDDALTAEGTPSELKSPRYPTEYPSDLDCRWTISSASGGPIQLEFNSPFNLEHGETLCYDKLTIYKGPSASDGVLVELCGEKAPSPILHPENSFLVTFTTDYMTGYEGFSMTYYEESPGNISTTTAEPTTTTENPCGAGEVLCQSGECIPSEQLCDGTENCSDGSDESRCGDCGQPEIPPSPTGEDKTRIINGEEAVPHSYPWMVSIRGAIDEHYCGASLLSPSWVLTAAHCAKIVFIGEFMSDVVVVGQHDRDFDTEVGKEVISIDEKFIHPDYDNPARAQDVALLKLRTPATLGSTVSTICLPELGDFGDSSSFPAGMDCMLSGWGKHGPGENIPGDLYGQPWLLRQAVLPLLDDATCSDIYLEGAGFTIQPTMQCAGGDGHTSCNGDSGGPLVCNLGSRWYQVGIVSFGPAPCDETIPAVYTRVAGFVDWITETIESNGGWI